MTSIKAKDMISVSILGSYEVILKVKRSYFKVKFPKFANFFAHF